MYITKMPKNTKIKIYFFMRSRHGLAWHFATCTFRADTYRDTIVQLYNRILPSNYLTFRRPGAERVQVLCQKAYSSQFRRLPKWHSKSCAELSVSGLLILTCQTGSIRNTYTKLDSIRKTYTGVSLGQGPVILNFQVLLGLGGG